MATETIPTGYVITESGLILVQRPADCRWGFELCDDDQVFPGGHGVASEWTLLAGDDPRITPQARERLSWLVDQP